MFFKVTLNMENRNSPSLAFGRARLGRPQLESLWQRVIIPYRAKQGTWVSEPPLEVVKDSRA